MERNITTKKGKGGTVHINTESTVHRSRGRGRQTGRQQASTQRETKTNTGRRVHNNGVQYTRSCKGNSVRTQAAI